MSQSPKFEPTSEQSLILNDTSRIRIVKAGPGTGKTALFAAALERLMIEGSFSRGRGVAAITFTRVARREIESRIGKLLHPPHFVGTLDSFVLRYIVKPFGHLVGLPKKGLKLIPDEFSKGLDTFSTAVETGTTGRASFKIPANVFDISFVGGTIDHPVITYPCKQRKIAVPVKGEFVQTVMRDKNRLWCATGMISHSDCQYIAAKILGLSKAELVKRILRTRFSQFFVDEVQDTGWFLSKMLIELFRDPAVKGFVVGDPDQAIYEFNGASHRIFDDLSKLEGASVLKLEKTRRCSKSVASVVEALSSTSAKVVPFETKEVGRVFVAGHNSTTNEWATQMQQLTESLGGGGGSVAILARKREVVYA